MSTETLLKLSIIQAELRKLAVGLDATAAKVLNQSAALLNLLARPHRRAPSPMLFSSALGARSAAEFAG